MATALMRSFTPRPWQPPMIKHGLNHERCAILARMGMGKSSATLQIIDGLLMAGAVRRVLVIAPLRVARSTWPEETLKWEEFAHLTVQPIVGDLAARKTALANSTADIYTVNYEVLAWLVEAVGPEHWPFDMVVADEATKLKNFRLRQGGKRAQALAAIAHTKVKRWINLTGTFVPNGLADLWGPMWFLDRGQRLGRSFDAFESRWFGYQRAKDAVNAHQTRVKRIVFPHAQAEIIDRIKDIALAFNPKDWFPVKRAIVVHVVVELPAGARKHYREMERELFTHIAGNDIEAFAASGKMIKCLQLANGAIYTGSDDQIVADVSPWVEAHDEKLLALEELVEDAQGEPVMVVYHFKPDLVRLRKRFPAGRHIKGKMDEDDFKAGLIPIAFVHASSIGHGVDGFQNVCRIIIFFALWWDLETHDQIIERIGPMRQVQAGFDREVMVYMILARGTVDETVAARLVAKRQLQDTTMDSLAHKPEGASL